MSIVEQPDQVAPPPAAANYIVLHHPSHGKPILGGDLADWLLGDGHRIADSRAFFDALCWRLVGHGVPLVRATMSLGTLHPQFLGLGLRWWRDRPEFDEIRIRHGVEHTADFLDSPMRPAMERGETVRHRLDGGASERFPLLAELRAAGMTDYLALPLAAFNRRFHTMTLAGDGPQGFTEAHVAEIRALLPALGVVVEAKAMQALTANVLKTYLGRTIGHHILAGDIQRRHGRRLRAVLMATDLRGFTALSDRLPENELIDLLDDYFDAVTSPLHDHGGEVLKFVGDGVLGIFPIEEAGEESAARGALAAAGETLARLAARNRERQAANLSTIRIGIGLHVGAVSYGNVGAIDRLDFTAIGPEVNLVCRLESLTKRLDRPLLVSHAFAALAKLPLVSLGFHPVKGFSEPEEVFGLAEPAT